MKKITFDNDFMSLWIASHSRIQRVSYLSEDDKTPKDHALLGMQDKRHVYGPQYPSDAVGSHFAERKYDTGLFIKAFNEFFEVAIVTNSQSEANEAMVKDDRIALICTDNAGFHYVASVEKTKFKKTN